MKRKIFYNLIVFTITFLNVYNSQNTKLYVKGNIQDSNTHTKTSNKAEEVPKQDTIKVFASTSASSLSVQSKKDPSHDEQQLQIIDGASKKNIGNQDNLNLGPSQKIQIPYIQQQLTKTKQQVINNDKKSLDNLKDHELQKLNDRIKLDKDLIQQIIRQPNRFNDLQLVQKIIGLVQKGLIKSQTVKQQQKSSVKLDKLIKNETPNQRILNKEIRLKISQLDQIQTQVNENKRNKNAEDAQTAESYTLFLKKINNPTHPQKRQYTIIIIVMLLILPFIFCIIKFKTQQTKNPNIITDYNRLFQTQQGLL